MLRPSLDRLRCALPWAAAACTSLQAVLQALRGATYSAVAASSGPAADAADPAAEGDAEWVSGASLRQAVAPMAPVSPGEWPPTSDLGPRALLHLLAAAPSPSSAVRLLLAHRDTAGAPHMLRAARRCGELASAAPERVPAASDVEAFEGMVELAFAVGQPLSASEACHLLEAHAWMRRQPSAEQLVVIEAAAVAGLADASLGSQALNRLLLSYIRLGLLPGPRLAAALAPPPCLAPQADGASKERPSEPRFVPLASEALSSALLLSRGHGLRRLLRLVLLHQPSLDADQLLMAVRGLGQMAHDDPRHLTPTVQAASAVLRTQALAALASRPDDGLDGPCGLLAASADLQLRPSAEEQAALEAALLRGMNDAAMAQVHAAVDAYDRLGMQPASAAFGAALQHAAESLMPAASPPQLRDLLRAWQGRRWPVTPALAAAAEARALQLLSVEGDGGIGAAGVAQLLEGFTVSQASFPASPAVAAALHDAVLRELPAAPADAASVALSCCRKLRLLPDEALLRGFVDAAPRILEDDSPAAFAFVPRLLMVLQLQGWHWYTAPPALQETMEALLGKQVEQARRLAQQQHLTPQERAGALGLVTHGMHLLAAVGLRPPDADLRHACRYLRRHQRELSRKQRDWLSSAFDAWQFGGEHSIRGV